MSDRRAGLGDWPNREHSRFVRSGGFTWHVQTMGTGPVVLLLHGTGAATHSWRGLMPILSERFTVLAPDLPGHGFTETPPMARMSLPGMARAVRGLLDTLERRPVLVVGHSAGAAIGLQMVLDGALAPRGVVGLNAALQPFGGMAGQIFSPLAKLLVGLPLLPELFSRRARDVTTVERLLAATGSRLDAEGVRRYAQVIRDPRHAAAALAMMARWDLRPLVARLPEVAVPLLLIAGAGDRTVPATVSEGVAARVPGARLEMQAGLGHLAHEEAPAATAALIAAFADEAGVA